MELDLKQYIEQQIPSLSGCLYPVFTTDLERLTVTYVVTHMSSGHVNQSQLELKIICKDYDACKEMENVILAVLCLEEDEPFVVSGNTRFHSGIAGGGLLFNDGCQMFEDTLYFMIDWRNINGR